MIFPTIHLNGTGGERLFADYLHAAEACSDLITAIEAIEFNGRDYYPQASGAWRQAETEHCARLEKIAAVRAELLAIADHVQQQLDAREAHRKGL